MKKGMNIMIVHAVELIAETNWRNPGAALDTSTYEVPKEFKGYISSFGASIIQAGLLPTLAFYSDKSADSKSKRWILLQLLAQMVETIPSWKNKLEESKANKASNEKILLEHALWLESKDQLKELRAFKQTITDAAIALKLALRTYKLT